MRYIDADKLALHLSDYALQESPNWGANGYGNQDAYDAINECIKAIDDQPTADVVEADKAQKEIDYWHDKAQSYEQTILKLSLNKADVVEVVRCGDCKYWQNHHDVMVCGLTNAMMSISDYCSYGERAEQ